MITQTHTFQITDEKSAMLAAYTIHRLASELNFTENEVSIIATSVAELATNIWKYTPSGAITFGAINNKHTGIEIIADDTGPGIPDIDLALTDNTSSSNSLGIGLPSVRRMMDEFYFDTNKAFGTKIIVRKWKK